MRLDCEHMQEPFLTIVAVCGAPHAGKSTYIADIYGDEPDDVIDMFQFQDYRSYPASMPSSVCCGVSNMLVELAVTREIQNILGCERRRERRCRDNDEQYIPKSHLLVVEGTYLRKARRMSLRQSIANGLDGADARVELVWVSRDGRRSLDFDYPDCAAEGFDSLHVVEDYEPVHDMEQLQEMVDARNSIDRVYDSGYFSQLPVNVCKGAEPVR